MPKSAKLTNRNSYSQVCLLNLTYLAFWNARWQPPVNWTTGVNWISRLQDSADQNSCRITIALFGFVFRTATLKNLQNLKYTDRQIRPANESFFYNLSVTIWQTWASCWRCHDSQCTFIKQISLQCASNNVLGLITTCISAEPVTVLVAFCTRESYN